MVALELPTKVTQVAQVEKTLILVLVVAVVQELQAERLVQPLAVQVEMV
jgi:hypothetical protein